MIKKVCDIVFIVDSIFLVNKENRIVGEIWWRWDIIVIIYRDENWRFLYSRMCNFDSLINVFRFRILCFLLEIWIGDFM